MRGASFDPLRADQRAVDPRSSGEPPVEKLLAGHGASSSSRTGSTPGSRTPAIMALLLTARSSRSSSRWPRAASTATARAASRTSSRCVVSFLRGLVDETIGDDAASGSTSRSSARSSLFIAMGNLFGLFFFLQPPTGSLSTTVGARRDLVRLLQLAGHPGARRGRVPQALHGAAAAGSRRSSSSSRSSARSPGSCRSRCGSS